MPQTIHRLEKKQDKNTCKDNLLATFLNSRTSRSCLLHHLNPSFFSKKEKEMFQFDQRNPCECKTEKSQLPTLYLRAFL